MGRHASASSAARPRRSRHAGLLGWGVFVAACVVFAGLLLSWTPLTLVLAAGLVLIAFGAVYALGTPAGD